MWRLGAGTALIAAGLLAGPAAAASFYGVLTENGHPLAGMQMHLLCGGQVVGNATSDARGSYGFRVEQQGACVVQAAGASTPVVLYQSPTRYDLDLRRSSTPPALVKR